MSDDEDIDSQFENDDSEGLVEMSEDNSEEEDDADPDMEDDESDASDEGPNESSNDSGPGVFGQPRQDFTFSSPRANSPTLLRRGLFTTSTTSRSYIIEPIIVLPHSDATHALAASSCLSHFMTGGEDGFIRDYDIFSAANGKTLLTAQQRAYAGLQDPNLKNGVLRSWWYNSLGPSEGVGLAAPVEPSARSPVYSMAVQADALWGLSGTNGPISLFTIRHDPGVLHHTLRGHTDVVSSMCLTHDEMGLMSVGWDGMTLEWDLNTGQVARQYPLYSAQLTTIAVRPLAAPLPATYNPYGPVNGMVGINIPPEGMQQYDMAMAMGVEHEPMFDLFAGEDADLSQANFDLLTLHPSANTITQASNGTTNESRSGTLVNENGPKASDAEDASGESDDFDPLFDDGEDVPSASHPTANDPGAPITNGNHPQPPPPAPLQQALPSAPLQLPGAHPSPHSGGGGTVGGWAQAVHQHQQYNQHQTQHRIPLLDPVSYTNFSPDIFMTAAIDGQVALWDRRANAVSGRGVGRLEMGEKTPPWCISACWSANGAHVIAGRRNGTIEVFDVRKFGPGSGFGQPKILRVLKNPQSSGPVSCVAAFPDKQHLVCASQDNIRLWNVGPEESDNSMSKRGGSAPFKIIAGHHGAISQILIDPASKFMVSASGNRGWWGESSKSVMVHSIMPQA